MTLHRLASTLAAAGLVALASPHALASGFTGQDDALLQAEATRAPLALSGDGAWRLHVDSHDVLHRASLADPSARESTLQLPHGVRVLSASGDGLKVALSTDRQCIGLADFTGDAPKLSWRPWVVSAEGQAIGAERAGWTSQLPATCGDRAFLAPVAISSDGRLVATPDAVVEAATNRVVASLPPVAQGHVLRLQFVDHDARLLIASATMGEHWEADPDPSSLSFSVWDLASKALVNGIEIAGTPLVAAAAMQVGFSPQTGALTYVDERRRDRAQAAAKPDDTPQPLDLVQLAPGACGSAPRTRASLDDVGPGFIVDPYGRWFASVRVLEAPRDAAEMATGARSVLVVRDMASGRQVQRVTTKYALTGLVSTPDGATLFALATQPREPETGEAIAGWPIVPDDAQLVQVTLPEATIGAPRDAAKAWERGFCKESGETPGARAMTRSEHSLKPLWSRDLSVDARAAASSELKDCNAFSPSATMSMFKSADGGLWLDLSTHVAKLDPLTGKTGDGLPTPRTKNVCSIVTPAGNGFLNAGGDTLTWRPLAAAVDPTKRRVVERHAGWSASFAQPQPADAVRVIWLASPKTAVDLDEGGNRQDLLVVDYDSNGKRLRQSRTSGTAVEESGGDFPTDTVPAPCHDARGAALAIGYDWRAGPFGSQRGMTCGPLPGMARLVWWSGATIAPRADASAPTPRAQPAIDGAIAVVADDSQLHVVDLALQREFAQIALSDAVDGRAWVLASRRLVLVEATGPDQHRWLRAYALP